MYYGCHTKTYNEDLLCSCPVATSRDKVTTLFIIIFVVFCMLLDDIPVSHGPRIPQRTGVEELGIPLMVVSRGLN